MEYENMRMPELKSPFQWGIKYCHWQHFTYSSKLLISDFFREIANVLRKVKTSIIQLITCFYFILTQLFLLRLT